MIFKIKVEKNFKTIGFAKLDLDSGEVLVVNSRSKATAITNRDVAFQMLDILNAQQGDGYSFSFITE